MTAHFDACDSNVFEELGDLVRVAGVVHVICAFEVFDRVLRDILRHGTGVGHDRAAPHGMNSGLPWRELAERHARAAIGDPRELEAFRADRSPHELRRLSKRLYASDSPALRRLADQLSP